jgi:hypothetical protein
MTYICFSITSGFISTKVFDFTPMAERLLSHAVQMSSSVSSPSITVIAHCLRLIERVDGLIFRGLRLRAILDYKECIDDLYRKVCALQKRETITITRDIVAAGYTLLGWNLDLGMPKTKFFGQIIKNAEEVH